MRADGDVRAEHLDAQSLTLLAWDLAIEELYDPRHHSDLATSTVVSYVLGFSRFAHLVFGSPQRIDGQSMLLRRVAQHFPARADKRLPVEPSDVQRAIDHWEAAGEFGLAAYLACAWATGARPGDLLILPSPAEPTRPLPLSAVAAALPHAPRYEASPLVTLRLMPKLRSRPIPKHVVDGGELAHDMPLNAAHRLWRLYQARRHLPPSDPLFCWSDGRPLRPAHVAEVIRKGVPEPARRINTTAYATRLGSASHLRWTAGWSVARVATFIGWQQPATLEVYCRPFALRPTEHVVAAAESNAAAPSARRARRGASRTIRNNAEEDDDDEDVLELLGIIDDE